MFIINGKEDKALNLDSGYFFGRAIFETLLVKDKPLFLEDHIKRLNDSSKILKIKKVINENEIIELINKFSIKNTVLKIVLSEENLILATRDFCYNKEIYDKGFNLCISNVIRNSTSRLTYIKSTNYIENILEREEAVQNGFQEVLFLNEKGNLTEGSFTNVFFIKNKEIFTPSKQEGLLDGIMRQWILNNYNVKVGSYSMNDIYEADEVFLTNSVFGIMKVKSVNFKDEVKNFKYKNILKIQNDYFRYIDTKY
ncbi:4-amino-4-deoxychorismate lyase [Clostridium cavendishii DSM 21758]|uniref:4-amino-4-deoxychorismate lyase n=1 Tax=Clostridium cavendishii DSM 21758 TaxID=1121302 RepID=A0A1M6EVQ4_9CLOT|nr:aminotransferase class IV [Clostridium cavendishii]SHI89521.1 4-amino-4-deoxychorismate lyase [Clostridium cavendishii DSM 21758]